MFVRFSQRRYRLQLSLIATHRVQGKVRHEYIASLGSIETPLTVADRIAFWSRLHQRLAKLGNRLDAETQGKVLGAIHARVPMATADEQRALQLDNAKADAAFWSSLSDMHTATAQDHKGLAANAQEAVRTGEAAAADAVINAKAAQERTARIERGEHVEGGLGKPMSSEDIATILIKQGFTKQDFKRMEMLADLSEGEVDQLMPEIRKAQERAEHVAIRKFYRRTKLNGGTT